MDESKKILILLNDPDPFLARVFKNKFKEIAGWDSIIADNFDDAIEKIHRQKPNILITEIIFKDTYGRNGFDLLQEIKRNKSPESINLKIIVLTELSQDVDRQKALAMGADEYIVKSQITATDLVIKIKDRLN